MALKTLDEIGVECLTDKSSITHHYLTTYEKYLEPLRGKEFVLLELGVASKASLNMWKIYFPNAHVFGVDNNPDCAGENIFIGDVTDEVFMDSVLEKIGTPFICIDDASHYGPSTIKTFEYLFPKIANGGQYWVEDTHCMYDSTYGCAPPFGQGMSNVFNFFTGLACDVDVHGRGYTGNTQYAIELDNPNFAPVPKYSPILDSIHIHPSLWLFKRK